MNYDAWRYYEAVVCSDPDEDRYASSEELGHWLFAKDIVDIELALAAADS